MALSKIDTLMQHSVSAVTANNAAKSSCNVIQGHYHGKFEISYFADINILRWAMTVGCLLDLESPAARYGEGIVLKRSIVGTGILESPEGNILIISDPHLPYEHKDTFDFLWAIKKKYKTKTILSVGDMIDHHTGSYHETEPDAYSPEEEYRQARKKLLVLQQMFPKMIITNGNHDELPKRKLKTIGLSPQMVSDYNKLYDLKPGWEWKRKHEFSANGARPKLIPMQLGKRNSRWDKVVI
jgi:hypothetical protein